MICSICGGQVEWQGPLTNLQNTKCLNCGATNCQIVESISEDDNVKDETSLRLLNRNN